MVLRYCPAVLSAIVRSLALAASMHTTVWNTRTKKWKNPPQLRTRSLSNLNETGFYLLFRYVNGFIQYYPHSAFPAAGMCSRTLVCHECIGVRYQRSQRNVSNWCGRTCEKERKNGKTIARLTIWSDEVVDSSDREVRRKLKLRSAKKSKLFYFVLSRRREMCNVHVIFCANSRYAICRVSFPC